MLTRREGLLCSGAIVASTLIWEGEANAFNLGGILHKVATTLVHAAAFVTSPTKQVAAASHVLSDLVRKVSPDAAKATDFVNRIADQAVSVENEIQRYITHNPGLVLPYFANASELEMPGSFFMDQSARAITVSSSDDDHFRHDPQGYINQNGQDIADFVNRYTLVRVPQSWVLPPFFIGARAIYGAGPSGNGYYGALFGVPNVFQLATMFII
jgi:hypothetical protein